MVNKQILQKSIIAQSKQFLSRFCSFKPAWTLLGKGLKPLSNVWFGQSCCYASSDKHSSNSENEAMLHLSYHLKITSVLQVFEDCKMTHIFLQCSANTGIWSEPNGFPYLQFSKRQPSSLPPTLPYNIFQSMTLLKFWQQFICSNWLPSYETLNNFYAPGCILLMKCSTLFSSQTSTFISTFFGISIIHV